VERVLAGAGLDGAASPFGVVVTASDVEHPKPAPDLYLAAAAALGVDPRRCAGLEDSPPGAASALAAGLFVIGVPYFPDGAMPDGIHLRAGSLADAAVHAALGV
jgi:beta-phosphoglucomutase-like phosphatase (HAD superfamily)